MLAPRPKAKQIRRHDYPLRLISRQIVPDDPAIRLLELDDIENAVALLAAPLGIGNRARPRSRSAALSAPRLSRSLPHTLLSSL